MTDDNTLDRRSVLRLTGGTVAASTVAAGPVTGQTTEEECTAPSEPLELTSVTRTEHSGPTTLEGDELPVVVGAGLLVTFPTESFSVPAEAGDFTADPDNSGCYAYRIDAELSWNPTESGPTNAGLFLYEGTSLDGRCIAKATGEDVAPQGANTVSVSVQGEGSFDGTNASGEDVTNDYTVGPDDYTMGVQGRVGVADFEATATASVVPLNSE
ncbi:hypothetical protein BRC75_07080 [Halobacteriales archaeon QH_7_69_31]|nr:MAG: hypothetical protein BRC75_07080 [Halobacteriales archaeon QH_7_69_31]